MSWGDRFGQLYNDATEAAQKAAQATLSSAKAAAKAVANAASKASEAVADGAQVAAKAASDAAKAAAQSAADAVKATAKAAKSAAQATAEATVSAGKAVAAGVAKVAPYAGEALNMVGSLAVISAALVYTYSPQGYLYRQARELFSPSKAPDKTVVTQCPFAKVDTFNNAYRKDLVDSEFSGADSPAMRSAMEELSKDNPANVSQNLEILAKERNRPVKEITDEYGVYREHRTTVLNRIAHSNNKLEPIDELLPEQKEFMGSNWQLRYGKVVGDNLGIDPVFGAMLNPTGGMVGPGNRGLQPDAWYMPAPVAYHGAYHDAAGYLYNYHEIDGEKMGPGYNYMQSPLGLSTANPLAGQGTGVAQWVINTR